MNRFPFLVWLIALVATATSASGQKVAAPAVESAALGQTNNVHVCGDLYLAGQPGQDDNRPIVDRGIKRIISLRTEGEIDWDEKAAMEQAGLEYVAIPFRSTDSLTDDVFDQVRKRLRDAHDGPTLLHCGSANRVGAVWLVHRVLDQGIPWDQASEEAKSIGLKNTEYEARARDYVARREDQTAKPSLRPGINDDFLKADLDIDQWLGRFEVESREIYAARHDILPALKLHPGAHVADVGAGTGFLTRMISESVGQDGWVYAVEIAPRFLEHINRLAQSERRTNITGILCTSDSVCLPTASIDVAVVCDTYHHFEYPQSTLASIRKALRPGGTLIVIDFERIPGQSREFVLNHVRAGKEVVIQEIEAAQFQLIEEVKLDRLQENYFLRWQKRD